MNHGDTTVTPRSVRALTVSRMCTVIAAKPLQFPYHDGVAFADVLHLGGQTGAVVAGAGRNAREGLPHPGRFKHSVLLIEGLGDCAYPDVPDPLAHDHRIGRGLLRKCGQRGIRDRYF